MRFFPRTAADPRLRARAGSTTERDLPAASRTPTDQTGRDDGNAFIEFVFLAVLLLVPTLYSLLALAHAQAGAYAAVASAQQVVQIVQIVDASGRDDVPSDGARRAAAFAAADYGFSEDRISTTLSCTGRCEGQNAIDVTVSVAVDAPFLGWISPHGIMTMTASATSWSGAYE